MGGAARQFLPSVRVERIRQDVLDVAGKDVVHSAPERCRCCATSGGPASVQRIPVQGWTCDGC